MRSVAQSGQMRQFSQSAALGIKKSKRAGQRPHPAQPHCGEQAQELRDVQREAATNASAPNSPRDEVPTTVA